MCPEWPPPWLGDVDEKTLARIRVRLDAMGGAQLEVRYDGSVGIIGSPRSAATKGRTMPTAIEALLNEEERWRAADEKKQAGAVASAKRLKRWAVKHPPRGRH